VRLLQPPQRPTTQPPNQPMAFEIPQADKKYAYVQSKFTEIAQRYDLFNDLITQGFHRLWKNEVVRLAGVRAGDQALDICCGTGDILQRLAQAVGPQGQAVGLDFSAGMLQVAASRNLGDQTQILQGDAQALPFHDGQFNAVTVGYGLRNLVDLHQGLSEVYRVLKPGGRFVSLDLGKVTMPVVKQLFHFYFFTVVPLIGKALYPGEDMFDYFPHSSLSYPGPEALKQMLEEVGFTQVSFKNYHFGGSVIHLALKPG